MRWYDRLMVGALVVGCIVLAVTFTRLGRNVAKLDGHRVPVTIVGDPAPPSTTPPTTDARCVNSFFLECA